MRYRFSARSKEGELRSGFLQASSSEDARAQLLRRGLELVQLDEAQGEAPVHIEPRTSAAPGLAAPARVPWWRQYDWSRFDWSRLLLALVGVVLVFGLFRLSAGWLLADRTYHMRFTGQLLFNTRRKLKPDFAKRARATVWLPGPRWFIFSNGRVVHYIEKGKFEDVDRKAEFRCQVGAEGRYTVDVEVALPSKPEQAHLSFRAPGFRRANRKVALQVKDHVFQAQLPQLSLAPRVSRRTAGRRNRSGSPRTRPGQAASPLP